MPLPGGQADKLGNRYELWWTVAQLVRMLDGRAESIRIEDPGVIKAEFVLRYNGCRELHQAKRSHQDGKWSIASLAGSDVGLLQAMYAQLTGNEDCFVFVSSSDARELAELTERARQAESWQEFAAQFLAARAAQENFEKIQKYWGNADGATTFCILRRIEVRTIDEHGIEEIVRWSLRALFLSNTVSIANALSTLVQNAVSKTVTRDAIVQELAVQGYHLRRLRHPEAASALVHAVTAQYLFGVRKRLIRQTLLPREATQLLLDRMAEAAQNGDYVLTGKAGAGKTGCVIEFVETLRNQGTPVLAFRLDHRTPVSSTHALGEQLGLEESPVLVLAAAAQGREAILVMDQLDAVSTTSGRSADFLDVVEGMLAEARGVRERVKLHVVVVCRTFDWENDNRLRRMLSNHHTQVDVAELSLAEVRSVLAAEGFNSEHFSSRQLELLRLPQTLALFLDMGCNPTAVPTFHTAKELFDRYWEAKRHAVFPRATPLQDQWMDVIGLLCEEMTRTQQLSIPREKLDRFELFAGQMASEGVLTLPENLRSKYAHSRFQELERKFAEPDPAPQGIRSHWVGPPIKQDAGAKMTDEQWLRAIAKYQTEDRLDGWEHPEKGGALALARMLQEFVRQEPERFARLSLQFPLATNPTYLGHVLEGLKGTVTPAGLKLDVCRKAFAESRNACGTAIADLLRSIEESLPDDAVEMLHWLATEHPDPEREVWAERVAGGQAYDGGDIYTDGINTTRGRAAEAVRDLIIADESYIARFHTTLARLVADPSLAVRSCAASTLVAIARHNMQLALELFATLALADDRLFATPHAERLIYHGLPEHFPALRPFITRMLRSTNPDVGHVGARLASLAALGHSTAVDLAEEAMQGDASQRLGVAEVAAANIAHGECRDWCEPRLLQLFNDEATDVRREAASCFRYLAQESLEDHAALIEAFCDSRAYQEDSFSILRALEQSLRRLPGLTCVVCEKFLARFAQEARDMRTHRAAEAPTVAKLIFRTYHQHRNDQWASRCLDLIDHMCLEDMDEVSQELEAFER